MSVLIKNSFVFENGSFNKKDIRIGSGAVSNGAGIDAFSDTVIDGTDKYLFPGFVDVHVHFREPGFLRKETILTGSRAAAHGGYTAVCTMPNLDPAPDSPESLAVQLEAIRHANLIKVIPYGTITKNRAGKELADMAAIAGAVVAFSDDGSGIQTEPLMREAMLQAKALGKIITAHCEDERLIVGKAIVHNGEYAKAHGINGICSESEWGQIERDLVLSEETGCAYHVCHISTKESVDLIRRAKARGVNVTCETAPHYLVFSDRDLKDDGRFKMNPPIRTEADRAALIEGIRDGTIDMIATDHAPHTAEEKSRGLVGSLMGIVGLETAFPVLYTHLVKTGVITLERLISLMSTAPSTRFGIENAIAENATLYDLDCAYTIAPETFESMGRSTPFEGMEVYGKNLLTIANGKIVWED